MNLIIIPKIVQINYRYMSAETTKSTFLGSIWGQKPPDIALQIKQLAYTSVVYHGHIYNHPA